MARLDASGKREQMLAAARAGIASVSDVPLRSVDTVLSASPGQDCGTEMKVSVLLPVTLRDAYMLRVKNGAISAESLDTDVQNFQEAFCADFAAIILSLGSDAPSSSSLSAFAIVDEDAETLEEIADIEMVFPGSVVFPEEEVIDSGDDGSVTDEVWFTLLMSAMVMALLGVAAALMIRWRRDHDNDERTMLVNPQYAYDVEGAGIGASGGVMAGAGGFAPLGEASLAMAHADDLRAGSSGSVVNPLAFGLKNQIRQ